MRLSSRFWQTGSGITCQLDQGKLATCVTFVSQVPVHCQVDEDVRAEGGCFHCRCHYMPGHSTRVILLCQVHQLPLRRHLCDATLWLQSLRYTAMHCDNNAT